MTTILTSTDSGDNPTRVVSRHVQQRVARVWDDPVATDAYIAELRDTTGLDLRVRRDPTIFPSRRARGGGMVFEDGVAYFPVSKRGEVVGAIELRTGGASPRPWRIVVALVAALFALGAVARRVSMQLARPLEHVAATAERFGSGDLTARTGVEHLPRRWVAEEVRGLGRAFDSMADRISRVVLEQRELLAAISHEVRSPLGRARIALEIARERAEVIVREEATHRAPAEDAPVSHKAASAVAEEQPSTFGEREAPALVLRALDDIDRQLIEIDAIVGDLLASARAGLADVRRESVDIMAWVEGRALAETTGEVEVSRVGKSGARLEIDPALLGRAVHNIFANAWAHGHPKDVPLLVTVSATDELVRISVRDRGPGFAADVLPRAFEPFVTGTGAARSPGAHGMGLGLALVRRIVEAHGGHVTAENVQADGKMTGAIVTIELFRNK
jgi:signal transduction histidine kinase